MDNGKLTDKIGRMAAIFTMNELTRKEIPAVMDFLGLIATILYVSCPASEENKTWRDIAELVGVAKVTFRNRSIGLRIGFAFNQTTL